MSWENSPVGRRNIESRYGSMLLRAFSLAIVPSMMMFAPLSAQTLHVQNRSLETTSFGILLAAKGPDESPAERVKEESEEEEKPKAKEKKADDKKSKAKEDKKDDKKEDKSSAKDDKKEDKAKAKDDKVKAKEASKDSKEAKETKETKDSKDDKAKAKDDSKDDKKKAAAKRDFFGRVKDEKAVPAAKPAAAAVVAPAGESIKKSEKKDEKEGKDEKTLVYEPDSALISVLKDLNRSIKDSEEFKKIEDSNERMIVSLAADVVNKALADPKLSFNRILAKEHENKARTRLTTEAWSSGDVEINDKFHGSISTVWAKRIDGLITVTVAGDCHDRKASDGHDVGEFLVVLTAHSPVVSGFDIQSQADVNFWLGKLSNITVEADCVTKPVAQGDAQDGDDKEKAKDKDAARGRDIKGSDEKKKPLAALPPLLTNRYRQFYELIVLQDDRRRLIAQQLLAMDPSLTTAAQTEADAGRSDADDEKTVTTKKTVAVKSTATIIPTKTNGLKAREISEDDSEEDEKDQEKSSKNKPAEVTGRGHDDKEKVARTISKNSKESALPDESDESDKAEVAERSNDKSAEDRDRSEDKDDTREAQADKKDGGRDKKEAAQKSTRELPKAVTRETAKSDVKVRPQAQVSEVKKNTETGEVTATSWTDKQNQIASATDGAYSTQAAATTSGATVTMVTTNNANFKSSEKGSTRPYNKNAVKAKEVVEPKQGNETAYAGAAASMERITGLDLPALKQPKNFTMLMPERALAGQPLTVAFVDEQRNPEANVELSFNGVTLSTDHNGQAQYMIPEDETPGRSLNIALLSRPYEMPAVVEVLQPLATPDSPQAPKLDRASHLVSRRSTLVIDGHNFDGVALNNRVIFDGVTEGTIAASSPVQLKVNLPRDLKPGKHSLCVSTEGMRSNPIGFELAQLEVSCDGKDTGKDVSNKVTVKVIGTTTKVNVKLVNLTPDLIRLSKGDEVKLLSSGGADNSASVTAQRLKKGAVKVEAWLDI
jgi:hypothetical protein